MTRYILSLVLAAVVVHSSFAQDFRRKLGNPSNYEMKMTVFEADTSAAAVVLYQNTQVSYELDLSGRAENVFSLTQDYEVRIKVLKPEGTDVANVEIPYFESGDMRESVRIVSAIAYNLEDNKVVKTQLKRDYIFDEQVAEKVRLKKFSVPDVKAGTVIEYKYTIMSNIPTKINDIEIQGDYPVVYSTGDVTIPEMLKYNVNTSGYNTIKVERKRSTTTVSLPGDITTEPAETLHFVAENIPALKDEPNVWSPEDFRTRLSFEISAFIVRGQVQQNFSTTWRNINKTLDGDTFGRNLKMSCPFSDDIKRMKAEAGDERELVRDVLKFVISKVRWDGSYRLYSESPRAAARNGSGTSADVNFILNSALREAGFTTTPILLNPRRFGRLPYGIPSLDRINAFVLMVQLQDGSSVIVDATDRDNDIDVLPAQLMVDRARIYGVDDSTGGWISLTNLSPNMSATVITCELTPEGRITGTVTKHYGNVEAAQFKSIYRSKPTEEEYVELLETRQGVEISDYEITDLAGKDVSESYRFAINASGAGDFLYMNATVIPLLSSNPLTQQERKLPLEFPYPAVEQIVGKITIPEGYAIEEMPKSERFKFYDDGMTCVYMREIKGNVIEFMFNLTVNRIIYNVEEYPDVFTFFGHVVSKCTSNIVIKKQ